MGRPSAVEHKPAGEDNPAADMQPSAVGGSQGPVEGSRDSVVPWGSIRGWSCRQGGSQASLGSTERKTVNIQNLVITAKFCISLR